MLQVIPSAMQIYVAPVVCGLIILLILPLLAGCILIVEHKIAAEAHTRHSALNDAADSRAHSLLQPIADAVEVTLQEGITPARPDLLLSWLAPLICLIVALLAFSVLPIGPAFQVSDLNIGLIFVLGMSSLGIYGVLLGSWDSNARYSPSGALRNAARLISYGTAGALGLISALLLSGSLAMKEIVQSQLDQGQWFIFYVPAGFVIYFIGSIAATDAAPVESPHPDRESVDGPSTEYSGFRWFLHFLTEYANMIVFAGIATTVFLGGWLRPLASFRDRYPGSSIELLDVLPAVLMMGIAFYCFRRALRQPVKARRIGTWYVCGMCAVSAVMLAATLFASEAFMQGVHGAFWFVVKAAAYIYCLLRIRFMFPGLRLALSKQLAWQLLVPVAFVNLLTAGAAILASQNTGLPMRLTTILSTLATFGVAWWLATNSARDLTVLSVDGE
jgi:NADH-quinone oxidoreductase subunit H